MVHYCAVMPTTFDSLPKRILRGTAIAAFDTSYKMSALLARLTAAQKLARNLHRLGGKRIVPPETFCVIEAKGPLYEGATERARTWAQTILAKLRRRHNHRSQRSSSGIMPILRTA